MTFAMIKPDAVRNRTIGSILYTAESTGFRIVDMRMQIMSQGDAAQLYFEHRAQTFFKRLITFTTSGPVILLCLDHSRGETIQRWLQLVGGTDPKRAGAGTLRKRFGVGLPDNAVHGSADEESAARELLLFFPPKDSS